MPYPLRGVWHDCKKSVLQAREAARVTSGVCTCRVEEGANVGTGGQMLNCSLGNKKAEASFDASALSMSG